MRIVSVRSDRIIGTNRRLFPVLRIETVGIGECSEPGIKGAP